MRYTRYNYKPPRKSNNFIFIFILILIAAISLGTLFSKLLPKDSIGKTGTEDKTTQIDPQKDSLDVSKQISQTNIKDYVALQCGFFSNKENALALKNSLMEFGTPFIVEEGNSNRVFIGIYPSGNIDGIVKQLVTKKITPVKINFQLIDKDSTSAQINEMIRADIQILNSLSEKDTKFIQTVELKKWLGTLAGSDPKSESYATMNEIKSYLTAMPAELKKEKTEEGYIYIYKFMKKILKT
ncbi:SPOR domain-containing protein [Clostridium sp.]|uniref:SPOR domain-containing protein n=1 Tax=Clostridium sp. TaxID=1506 RepID=UPI001A51B749|nr:SPOR domain-containing protein [Clostridium sp.]MBK5234304.1 SPOR domain-containing protein [Clostridium sp.]